MKVKMKKLKKMSEIDVLQKVCNYHGFNINVYQVLLWAEMIFKIKIIGVNKN